MKKQMRVPPWDGHVAYQIKGNHECSQMIANILPTESHLLPWGWGQTFGQNSTFPEHGHVAYQIKGNVA